MFFKFWFSNIIPVNRFQFSKTTKIYPNKSVYIFITKCLNKNILSSSSYSAGDTLEKVATKRLVQFPFNTSHTETWTSHSSFTANSQSTAPTPEDL